MHRQRTEYKQVIKKNIRRICRTSLTSLWLSTNYPVVAKSHFVKQVFWLVPSVAPSQFYNQWQRVR